MYAFAFTDLSYLAEDGYRAYAEQLPRRLSEFDAAKYKKGIVMSVCGELLARRLITRFTGVTDFEIIREKGKKPRVNIDGIDFSISHSGDIAAAVVSDAPCGADVQEIRPVRDSLIERVCSPEEKKALSAYGDPSAEFIRLWTVKESYLKMTGEGITREMNSVSRNMENCVFYEEETKDGYMCTVCIGGK